MSLQEDFRDLGFELARAIKKEIDNMKDSAKSTIEFIEQETERKIKKDLRKLEDVMIQNAEYNLNKVENTRINEINQNILLKKTQCVDRFIVLLATELKMHIKKDPKPYFNYLSKQISNYTSLVTTKAEIHFSKRDLSFLKADPSLLKLKLKNIQISEEPISTVLGFKLTSPGIFDVDATFEGIMLKQKSDLAMKFMQIFPVFEVNVTNAFEIYETMQKKKIKYNPKKFEGKNR